MKLLKLLHTFSLKNLLSPIIKTDWFENIVGLSIDKLITESEIKDRRIARIKRVNRCYIKKIERLHSRIRDEQYDFYPYEQVVKQLLRERYSIHTFDYVAYRVMIIRDNELGHVDALNNIASQITQVNKVNLYDTENYYEALIIAKEFGVDLIITQYNFAGDFRTPYFLKDLNRHCENIWMIDYGPIRGEDLFVHYGEGQRAVKAIVSNTNFLTKFNKLLSEKQVRK